MSFITGQFSTKGKEAHIIPYKKGDKLENALIIGQVFHCQTSVK